MVHFVLVFCVFVVAATVVSLVWNFLVRPVLYTTGWVRTTAHDLEVAGWQAECDADIPTALRKYAESLNLEPRNAALLAKVEALLEAHPWVRFEWPDAPGGGR
ncbi:hypothetical protein [Urbifossiella limnaea]|uniref:hypothetical protein n=1 Tax=Urbifossiella limnaea TaxID=2528023 RepID=UPI00119D5AF5|nr:hypothetical protein [Urbifossiella limnaea]